MAKLVSKGSSVAMSGAKIATRTKNTTNTEPNAPNGLRRPNPTIFAKTLVEDASLPTFVPVQPMAPLFAVP